MRSLVGNLLRRRPTAAAFDAIGVGDARLLVRRRRGGSIIRRWKPDWKTDLIKRVLATRPGVLLDVGANVGQTMLDYIASGTGGGYIGFEPNPRAAEFLLDIIHQNSLADCSIVPAALSDRSGIATFYVQQSGSVDLAATIIADLRPKREVRPEHVSCHRMDDIAADLLKGRQPTLLKIDVEGAELEVLRGMPGLLKNGPWIICEVNGRDPEACPEAYRARIRELMDCLRAADYAVFRVGKCGEDLRLGGFTAVESFPDVVLTPHNHHEFDYIFIPARDRAQLLSIA